MFSLSLRDTNNLTGNKGKRQNVRTIARTRGVSHISLLCTGGPLSCLLPLLASPQHSSICPFCTHFQPLGTQPFHPDTDTQRAGSQLRPLHCGSGPSCPESPSISTEHLLRKHPPPLPPSEWAGLRGWKKGRGESPFIPFPPARLPKSGPHPLLGAEIQQYIQPAAATGHVSPLLGYRDPKINPSQPD